MARSVVMGRKRKKEKGHRLSELLVISHWRDHGVG